MHGKANKIKGIIMAVMLIGAAVIWNYGQQQATAQQRPAPTQQNIAVQPIGDEPVSAEQLRSLQANPKIREAAEMLAAQGEDLDFPKAKAARWPPPTKANTSANANEARWPPPTTNKNTNTNANEARWPPPTKANEVAAPRPVVIIIPIKASARSAAGQKPEYGKLIYEKGVDGKELVYFDEPTGSRPAAQDNSENARLLGCGAWSNWNETGRDCRATFWTCMVQNQRAIFISYRRERQCRNRTQVQTKTVRMRCDC